MPLEFTRQAQRDLNSILDSIEINFGERVALEISQALYAMLAKLPEWPEFGTAVSGEPNLRRLVFRKRTVVYYQLAEDKIIVTAVKSTYQNYTPKDIS